MHKWLLSKSLFGAIINRDYETIRLALKKGADPNSYNKGLTALMRACITGDDVIISLIVSAGADPKKLDKSGRFNTFQFCEDNGFEHKIEYINTCASIYENYLKLGVDPLKRL